jgi:hypothetical protein
MWQGSLQRSSHSAARQENWQAALQRQEWKDSRNEAELQNMTPVA